MPESGTSTPVFVENRFIRVGVELRWGGAVTHVSKPGGPNLINSYDLGRQIQQSYYSGPSNYQRPGIQKSPHWSGFPWNPIQTGDAYRNGSKVVRHEAGAGHLYVKTVPMLWPMNNDPGECVMETWIDLSPDGSKFLYRARLTNARSDREHYPARHQEVPAVYVNGPWHRLMTYRGARPFAGDTVVEVRNDHKENWPWVNFLATEGWAALVNDAGTGIGVCVPSAMEFHGGFHGLRGVGDDRSANTGYMSPVATEILDHNIVFEYSCTFVLGSVEEIRAESGRLASKALPGWKFDGTRKGWHYQNGGDAGWPLTGGGLTVRAVNASSPVRLIGPFVFWRAEAAPQVAVLVSSGAAGAMTVFWRGMPPDDASAKPSAWGAWKNAWWNRKMSASADVPAGKRKWVRFSLAGMPGYTGGMTGLAIDVPAGVTVHEVKLVAE